MNNHKITLLYLRSVSPILFFIFGFNELSLFFMISQNTGVYPWLHLIQSTSIAVFGYLICMIPSVILTERIGKTCRKENPLPDDLKLLTLVKSMRGLSVTIWVVAFIVIVLPRLTGLFLLPTMESSYFFVSRYLIDIVISLILWGAGSFLSLFFFRTGIENLSDISFITKYSHLHIKRGFSFAFVLMFALFQMLFLAAALTISAGAFFAENAIYNPTKSAESLFMTTTLVSGVIIAILLLIFMRVFKQQQYQKVQRTGMILDAIEKSGRPTRMNIVTIDEFGDLYESINLLTDNTQTAADSFASITKRLHTSLQDTESICEEIQTPLKEITRASSKSAESNGQIGYLARSDKNVHNLNATTKMMEEQITTQEEMVAQTSVSIGQMSSSIAGIIQTIQTAAQLSDKLKNYSTTGNKAIEDARKAIEEIQEAAQSVSEILTVIQRIAAQTNLLSMNASIEAAHAGTSGTGFALVAQSVRTLADASTKSAKKIENHISEMSEWIQIGTQTINSITKTFAGIQKGINENSELISTISDAMSEEEDAARDTMTAIESVVSSVRNVKEKFQTQKESAINIEETITLIIDLSDQMQQLLDSEKSMTEQLNESIGSVIQKLEGSKQSLDEIDKTNGRYAS